MSIDKKYIEIFSNITSMAAYSCFKQVGKKNKKLADKAAVDSMRNELNKLEISGEVVIGEGELDEAPMLFIGEKLGKNIGPILILQLTLVMEQILPQIIYPELYQYCVLLKKIIYLKHQKHI